MRIQAYASTIKRMAEMTPNISIAQDSTDRVGNFLIRGATRIEPTHCIALLRPVRIPIFWNPIGDELHSGFENISQSTELTIGRKPLICHRHECTIEIFEAKPEQTNIRTRQSRVCPYTLIQHDTKCIYRNVASFDRSEGAPNFQHAGSLTVRGTQAKKGCKQYAGAKIYSVRSRKVSLA